jgi:sulfoxide reductase heme-binding subunit YedZ
VIYVERQQTLPRIVSDAQAVWMWTGWLALALMLVLAATSNDQSVRLLRRRWLLVHRLIYVAALLTFAHWILSAFDPTEGFIYLGVFVVLELVRLVSQVVRRPY